MNNRAMAAYAKIEGMKSVNTDRARLHQPPFYTENDFFNIADKLQWPEKESHKIIQIMYINNKAFSDCMVGLSDDGRVYVATDSASCDGQPYWMWNLLISALADQVKEEN